ncbi:ATP synthase F1 subcomplex gamma subunit [Mariniphaga anaerophila]|uniref:ATP synthase gamma chain n=1 Tax=Mariniphaga anaerophila TaxID=1484053 RepID=A0A1M5CRQ8_9BACT|nr:ATP synthase F1 subunit gamma [Mariniphaga anaerophila]SHF57403.1 ATP synthase F1 subcomplex gamma subunit [Mariniphaga anaerophila]
MAGLKEIRTRISSVTTTRQVTSAMKMVSAAKLKKAQDAILQIRPYVDKLHQILVSIGSSLNEADESVYTQQREPEKILVVLISSNRGLCGGFNMNIAKKSVELVHSKYSLQFQMGNVDFLCIGKQAEKQVKLRGMNVVESHHELFDTLDFEHVYVLAEEIMKDFAEGKYDTVELVYNQFLNAATQINTTEQFLPVEMETEEQGHQLYDYIFEPSKEYMIKELIPRSLKIQFYKAMLDSHAAEHGARMTAMHQATDNASELLKDLTLQYNKVRQASITSEILEIVSGAEALNG